MVICSQIIVKPTILELFKVAIVIIVIIVIVIIIIIIQGWSSSSPPSLLPLDLSITLTNSCSRLDHHKAVEVDMLGDKKVPAS